MSLSETLASAELRTQLALRQIDEIKRGEHTHEHTQKILSEIADNISANQEGLKRAVQTADPVIIRSQAANLILDLGTYLPLLGFILRSSDVRNAFEVFDPLITMCSDLLGPSVRLIYSSEWDYSPFTRTFTFPKLQNVVVVGLPAHESSNALIVPVVGHELGHAKWKSDDLVATLGPDIERNVIEYVMGHLDDIAGKAQADMYRQQPDPEAVVALFVPEVSQAQFFAKLQCEEVFCDIVGTRIFGSSYLRAFAYLIFPSPKGQDRHSFDYPGNRARIRYMKEAAEHFGTPVSDDFGEDFDDVLPKNLSLSQREMIQAADTATDKVFSLLLAQADRLFGPSFIPKINPLEIEKLKAAFSAGRPGDGIFNLGDIIEAAWLTNLDTLGNSKGKRIDQLASLNEIVFKTIEVAEFYRQTTR